jgi:hypothetical protein
LRALGLMWQRQDKTPLDQHQFVALALAAHSALEAVRTGAATDDHANTLALAANVALVLCDAGLLSEHTAEVKAGQAAVLSLYLRHQRTGRAVFAGPELQHAMRMLQIHDAQLENSACTQGLMSAALVEIHRRMQAGDVMTDEHARQLLHHAAAEGSSSPLTNPPGAP